MDNRHFSPNPHDLRTDLYYKNEEIPGQYDPVVRSLRSDTGEIHVLSKMVVRDQGHITVLKQDRGYVVDGDLHVHGNLSITGTTRYTDVEVIRATDNVILLNHGGNATTAVGGGLRLKRGPGQPDVTFTVNEAGEWCLDRLNVGELNFKLPVPLQPELVQMGGEIKIPVLVNGERFELTLKRSVN